MKNEKNDSKPKNIKNKPRFIIIKQKEIDINQIQQNPYQPRSESILDIKDPDSEVKNRRLLNSIQRRGILDPIKVTRIDENLYQIVDGHRRHFCAKKLGFKFVPCVIYQESDKREIERDKFDLQTNQLPWKPLERANLYNYVKVINNFEKPREIAEFLNVSEASVAYSLQIRDQNVNDLDSMQKYDLNNTFRLEFVRLKPRLRKIKEYEVTSIVECLFKKIKNGVITNARNFRKLSKIFERASVNEKEIYEFLSNNDMTIDELDERTTRTGFSKRIDQLIHDIAEQQKNGTIFEDKEIDLLKKLQILIQEILKIYKK